MNKSKIKKNRLAKVLIIIYFILLCLPATLYVVVRIPFIQNAIVQKATDYLSKELQTEISIKKIDINFFLNVSIHDLKINDLKNKELLFIKQLDVHLKKITFKKNRIHLSNINIKKLNFNLTQYKGENINNLQFIIDYFTDDRPKETQSKSWKINIYNLRISNGNFAYLNENKRDENYKGIDFDNLRVRNINFWANNIIIDKTISLNIEQLKLNEHSGFVLKSMSTNLTLNDSLLHCENLKIKTSKTDLDADIKFDFNNFSAFSNFIEEIDINAYFRESTIHFADISLFAPTLNQKHFKANIQGKISGRINDLSADSLNITTESMTEMLLSCSLKGLPDINKTEFNLALTSLTSGAKDLKHIIIKTGLNSEIYNYVKNINYFNIYGEFIGSLETFKTKNVFSSNIGNFAMDMIFETYSNTPKYYGKLITSKLNIGKLIDNELLGAVSSELSIEGTNLKTDIISLITKGQIHSLFFNNYDYQNITLNAKINDGTFNGNVNIDDKNINLAFDGKIQFADSIPSYYFESKISNANLSKLHFNRNDSLAYLSANLKCMAFGSNIDNFLGEVTFEDIKYLEGKNSYFIPKLNIVQKEDETFNQKRISVESNIINGYIEGKYKLSEISDAIEVFLSEYISNYASNTQRETPTDVVNLQFAFDLNDFDIITDLFMPDLHISKKTKINGKFHSNNNILNIYINSDNITYSGIEFIENNITIEAFVRKIYLGLSSQNLQIYQTANVENVKFDGVVHNDSINYSLFWDNYKNFKNNSGDIKGSIVLADSNSMIAVFGASEFTIEDNKWEIDKYNKIYYSNDSLSVNNLRFYKDEQQILIRDDKRSKESAIEIVFSNFDLQNIAPFLEQTDFSINGIMHGSLFLRSLFSNPYFTTDILASNFYLQKEFLGDLKILSKYNTEQKYVGTDINIKYTGPAGVIEPIKLIGKFYPEKEDNNIDYSVNLTNYNIKTLSPFVKDFLDILDGKATGNLKIQGSLKDPKVSGDIQFIRTVLHVYYLNSIFSFADKFHITNNRIYTDNLTLLDQKGNRSSVRMNIAHNKFKDFKFDIQMNTMGDFQFMNTTSKDNNLFYGTVIADGRVLITGDLDEITMSVNAKTGKGTSFSIPIDESGYAHENKFITFVSQHDIMQKEQKNIAGEQNEMNFKMNLDLQVTPDAEVQIIFDPTVGDIMRGKGEGDLKIEFDMAGDLRMFGDLNILGGEYLFTLENVINKRFYIASGGSIKWKGDPYNANIDLTTYYPIRTGIYSLINHIDPSEVYKQKVPVHLQLLLKNNLMSPEISFNIDLPQADENTKNLVKNALISEQELNRQVFALLILNSFVPPDQIAFNTLSSQGIGTTSTELLSNQLSNWLSQISKDFDIGVKYRPGGEVTNDEVELMFSTQFFNDRIKVEGNLGFGGQQLQGNTQQQQFLGDVNIEYRITSDGRISAKTFNRSNPIDIITQNTPYTQGVGIFYRRDFNKFSDLWKQKNKTTSN